MMLQVYTRLNQVAVCVSYKETLRNVEEISKLHTAPMSEWISDNVPFRFWGDNVDKKRGVQDVRSDHQGELVHMYSILAGHNRTANPTLSHTGCIGSLSIESDSLLPTTDDIQSVKLNMVVIVSRYLTKYIEGLKTFSKAVPSHIKHQYSKEMTAKSSVVVVDVLLKNEACHGDMHSQKVVHVQEFPMCTRFLSLYSICKLLGNFLLLLETPRKWTKFHKFGNCFAH